MFEKELIDMSPPCYNTVGKPTDPTKIYGSILDQPAVAPKAGKLGGDFTVLWTRGNVVVSVSSMADSVGDFWIRNRLARWDKSITPGGPLPHPTLT